MSAATQVAPLSADGRALLLDGCRGSTIPEAFATEFDHALWRGVNLGDVEECALGPGAPEYWEAWENILSTATLVDTDGNVWTLWQDGDLWAVCDTLLSEDSRQEFYGAD